jgi:hypothetical protein
MLREMSGGHGLFPPYVPWLGAEAEDSVWSCQDEAAVACIFCSIFVIFVLCWQGECITRNRTWLYHLPQSQK